jgi:transposase InsO family protein
VSTNDSAPTYARPSSPPVYAPPPAPTAELPSFNINPALSETQRAFVATRLEALRHTFAQSAITPQASPGIQHAIHLTDSHPIKQAPYRQSPAKRDAVRAEVQRLLKLGVIYPSSSPWSSPVSLVPKADGSWRMVIDYRRVNAQTRKDAYPVPLIEECLMACKEAKYMSMIDIKDAYHHIEMALESRGVTAFVTADGLFEWARMPFGLANAPATFQRYVDQILREFIGEFCAIFFDDCLVYTNGTLAEHMDHVEKILRRLHSVGLEASAKKCRFAYGELLFVGHIVGKGQIKPDPEKLKAVKEFPVPTTTTELKGFLGLANYYRRFVDGFASTAKPLYEQLKKNVKFEWSQSRQLAFQELKRALTRAPCLFAPDFSIPFILQTDASGIGISGVLSQIVQGEEHPVGFVSRQLNKAEKNYTTTELECLAVVWSIGQFESFLLDKPFKVVTDHSALVWLAKMKHTAKRPMRWALALQEYSFTVQHRAGKANANADALSRAPCPATEPPLAHPRDERASLLAGTREAHFIRRAAFSYGPDDIRIPIFPYGAESARARTRATRTRHRAPLLGSRDSASASHARMPDLDEEYELTTVDLSQIQHVAAAQAHDPSIGPLYRFLDKGEIPHEYDAPERARLVRQSRNFALLENDDKVRALFYHPTASTRGLSALVQTPPRLVIPKGFRQQLMHLFHSSPFGGHSGVKRTLGKIAARYYWNTLYGDVTHFVTSCQICQQVKHQRHIAEQRTGRLPDPMEPWEVVSLDYIGPLPEDQGFNYVLVVVDHFSQYLVTVPTRELSAGTTARALYDEVICRFGMPRRILTDRGTPFHNRLFDDLGELLNIKKHLTSAHHPQANGKAERFVGTLKNTLTSHLASYKQGWLMALQASTFAINAAPSATHAHTPFFLVHGREPHFPAEDLIPLTFGRGSESEPREAYARQLASQLHDAYAYVRNLNQEKARQYEQANAALTSTPTYKEGDLVWLRDHRADSGLGLPAFARPFYGPFVVQRRIHGGSTYIIRGLKDGKATGVQMTMHASRLRPNLSPPPTDTLTTPAIPPGEAVDTVSDTAAAQQPATQPPLSNEAASPSMTAMPPTPAATAPATPLASAQLAAPAPHTTAAPAPPATASAASTPMDLSEDEIPPAHAPTIGSPAAAALQRHANSPIPLYSESGLYPTEPPHSARYSDPRPHPSDAESPPPSALAPSHKKRRRRQPP